MHFERLRIFAEVATQGGFTRAAESLCLSQPNVSTQVKLLEQELGAALFRQVGRRVQLTAAGETLYRYAQDIFQLAREAEGAVHGIQGLERGALRVGGSMTPGVYVLPGMLGRFKRAHPGLHLRLEIGNSASVRALLHQGELDVGVVGKQEPAERQLEQDPFLEDELALVVAPEHPWAERREVAPDELAEAGLIAREPGSGTRAAVEAALRQRGCDVPPAMEIGSTEAIKLAVAAGLGVTILSRCTVAAELRRGELREVRLAGGPIRRCFYLLYPRARRPGGPEAAFVQFLREHASSV